MNAVEHLKELAVCDVSTCKFPTKKRTLPEELAKRFVALGEKVAQLEEEKKAAVDVMKALAERAKALLEEKESIWDAVDKEFPELDEFDRKALSKDNLTVTASNCDKNCIHEAMKAAFLEKLGIDPEEYKKVEEGGALAEDVKDDSNIC